MPPLCRFGSSTCSAWGDDRKWGTLHISRMRENPMGLRNTAWRVSHPRRATLRGLRLARRWKRNRPHLLSQSLLRGSRTQYRSLMATRCRPREEQRRAFPRALTGLPRSPIPWRRQHHHHRHRQGRSRRHRGRDARDHGRNLPATQRHLSPRGLRVVHPMVSRTRDQRRQRRIAPTLPHHRKNDHMSFNLRARKKRR